MYLDHYGNSKTTQIKLAFGGIEFLICFMHIFLVSGKSIKQHVCAVLKV